MLNFQTAKEPETGKICVASPVGAYDSLLFIEHPLYMRTYLPHWFDGYFQMLDLTSEMIAPHLDPIVQGGQVEDIQILREHKWKECWRLVRPTTNKSCQTRHLQLQGEKL